MAESQLKEFPAPLPYKKLLGPSFVILAMGLGSGEVILWPYLVSNYGLGIAWGALLGITFQYFMNMEIERYALVKGESVFVGFHRLWKFLPYWFIISTFVGFGLPGIIAASSQVLAYLFGVTDFRWIAISLLLLIGLVISFGKTVYQLMEKTTKTIILIAVPFIFILAIVVSKDVHWARLAQGLVGMGEGYSFLPMGIALATFLGAFAYSGAGGNLNLTQSIYIKEKGYGMGYHAQKIAGLFHHNREEQEIKLTGENFAHEDLESQKRFVSWWRRISLEHLFVFWFLGLLAICLLMILSYSTTFGQHNNNAQGIMFVINEGLAIGSLVVPKVGIIFLIAVVIMLFQTQLGILDSTSRIMAENFALKKIEKSHNSKVHLSKIYFTFLWAQIAFGVILFLFNITEPKSLIVLGASINAVAMAVHTALVAILNKRELPVFYRPKLWREIIMTIVFVFFAGFSLYTFWNIMK